MKKRFNTANDIRDAIDAAREKAQRCIDEADALDIKAKQLRQNGPQFEEDAKFNEQSAKKLRAQATRLRTVKLRTLKDKLSEWMTPQLPALDNKDPSIPA